jgi:hypothetical protein
MAWNWLSSVAFPASDVPEAFAVTRLSSNDRSAERLLGARPSVSSVRNASLIAVNCRIVVFDASSIVWMSFWSVWIAV